MSEIKVNSIKGVGASAAAITVNNTDGTCIANITNNLSNRNLIINGAMQCYQRGSSFTLSGSDNNIYTADRFQHSVTSGASFAATHTISDDHPDGFSKSLLISPTATNTPTGTGNAGIRTKLEGQNLQSLAHGTSTAKKVTLSFYAKSSSQNNGHQYSVQLRKFPSSDASSRPTVTRAFTVTTSWQRFSFTIIGDTSAVIRNENLNGMEIVWNLAAGPDDIVSEYTTWTNDNAFRAVTGQSNFLDNTSNEFYLTGIQLEVDHTGSGKPTDFEHRSFAQELALCQRYAFVIPYGENSESSGFIVGTPSYARLSTAVRTTVNFPVPMRSNPTFTGSATNILYSSVNSSANFLANTVGVENANSYNNVTAIQLRVDSVSSITSDTSGTLSWQASGGFLKFESEL